MHPQLAAIVRDFEHAQVRLDALSATLTPEDWSRRPDPQRWAPIECVAHLNLTSQAFIPVLREAVAGARRSGRPAPGRYRRDLVGWLIATLVSPRPWIRTKTTAAFVPTAGRAPDVILEEFRHLQQEQIAIVHAADGLPIDRVMIASPFDPRARYSAYSALTILPRHQHRHLTQAHPRRA